MSKSLAAASSAPMALAAEKGPPVQSPNQASELLVLAETIEPGLVRLTLNRPNVFNALSEGMLLALQSELDAIAANPAIRVLIIAGSGKAFCAGHDLKEMRAAYQDANSVDYYKALFARCSRMMLTLKKMPQPVIAQVHGIATAAGCQLVAMADLAVASSETRFAVSGINYGLFCSTPSVGLSRNLLRKQAMEMLLTGDFIDAQQAKDQGLINQVCANDDLNQVVIDLARKIMAKNEAAVRMGKALFYAQLEVGIEKAYEMAGQTMACNLMDANALEGIQAFIEKRPPNYKL
jgi:enoyl-CoA hydratase/carnithine racemase